MIIRLVGMLPLQVPGGPELLVIALIGLILIGIVAVIVWVVRYLGRTTPDEQG